MLYFIYRDCVLKRLLFEMTGTIWIGLSAYYFIVKNWAKIKGIENYINISVDSYKSRRKRRKTGYYYIKMNIMRIRRGHYERNN